MSYRIILVMAALVSAGSLALATSPARSGELPTFTCFDSFGSVSCVVLQNDPRPNPNVIHVPRPRGKMATKRAQARDRSWVEHCRPRIRQDIYGVSRYVYASPGCEFGRIN